MTRPLCIYHGDCADGFGAAWVVWKAFNGDVDFFAGIYGQPAPDVTGRKVYIVDFSYKREVMEKLINQASGITVIDHHKTAEAELQPLFNYGVLNGVFDMTRSGAMLTWDWFFQNQRPPELLLHIEDRDLWAFKLSGTREIQAGLFSYPYDFEVWDRLIMDEQVPSALEGLARDGVAIERKHFKDIEELVKVSARPIKLAGFVVEAANLPYTMASDAAGTLATRNAFGVTYFDTKDGRCFSLRSRGDFDVSEIAKRYGGGGHKNAAGFVQPHGWYGEPIELEGG